MHLLHTYLNTCFLGFLILCTPTACRHTPAAENCMEFPTIFPDYTQITIPPNIAPLNFYVNDAEQISALFTLNGKEVMTIEGENLLQISADKWTKLMKLAIGKHFEITVSAWNKIHPKGIRYRPFSITVSKDSIDPWVAYRLIPPGYESFHHMGLYQRNLSNFQEIPFYTGRQNNNGCVNCHSFNQYKPEQFIFHDRGEKGGTLLYKNGNMQKLTIEKLKPFKGASYPYWHPSGRYIAFSSNTTRQSFYHRSRNKIEVYDLRSDLIIYDIKNKRVLADDRFNEETRWETFPAFSPDGKYLYFCTAQSVKMPVEYTKLKYALCRVSFDTRTGKLGQTVDTLYNPTEKGGSVSFPRISPDGRYLLYTETTNGTFPIVHKDADLQAIDLIQEEQLDCHKLNSPDVESYHSWSSNGKWIIFSSKRIDGRYTRLFIAHVNAQGQFERPFLLPQKDPAQNRERLNAYNIPEFIKGPVKLPKDEAAALFGT